MPNTSTMGPNSAHFNFAQYLLDCNAQRPEKLAFVDDLGSLSYGALADRIRGVAGALRGCGVGRRLAEAVMTAAQQAGYATLLLDTLSEMETARAMYQDLGFTEVPPYYYNPIEGAHYLMARL